MAKLEAFELPGFVVEMYPEDHSPPHFHVIKDDWNIRIKFNLSIIKRDIVWDAKYPENLRECPLKSGETKTLLDLIRTNLKTLNKQWKALHPNRRGQENDSSKQETGSNRSRKKSGKGDKKS
jgi:hypothetical protein